MAFITTVVNAGLAIIASLLSGSGTVPKNVGMGTGTTEAAVTDTGLETPAESRVAGTASVATTTTANDTFRVVAPIVCTATPKAITEVAIFDDIAAGNCFLHANFAAINLAVGDSINFTISTVIDQGV